jgi:hypothetical protein
MIGELQVGPELLVRAAGYIQLVQVPLMFLLARRFEFLKELAALSLLARQLVKTFAQGIALCVTGLGIVVVRSAEGLVAVSFGHDVLFFLVVLFSFRTWAQWSLVGKTWPGGSRALHYTLLVLHGSITVLYGSSRVWLALT